MSVRETGSGDTDFAGAAAPTGDVLPPHFADAAPVGLGLIDPDLQWVYVNAALLRTTGLERAQLLGRPVAATPFAADAAAIGRILVDDASGDQVVDGAAGVVGDAAVTGWHVRYRRLESEGRVLGVTAAVAASAPEQLHALDRARRRLVAQVAAADRIGTTLDIDVTCRELADFTVPAMSDLTLVEVVPLETAARGGAPGSAPPRLRVAAFAAAPEVRRLLGSAADPVGDSRRPPAESAVAQSLRAGGPVAVNFPAEAEWARLAASAADAAAYRLAGAGSILAAPLIARGRVVGAVTLVRVGGRDAGFTEDDIVLVQDLADRAAVSVENARQYADAQRLTLELQRALLVEPGPPHANLEIAARYLPLGGRNLVGGDWYEIIRLPFGRTLLVMADVMGHGTEAAVDMSHYRSIIRELGGMDLPPHGILAHLDSVIAQDESARPATCLLAVADPSRGRWTLAAAGHLPPALFVAGRATRLIPIPIGPPLGTGVGGYAQITVDLLPDQILLLYTDGLVERRGEDIDVSLARLASVAVPETLELEDLLHEVLRSLASSTPDDDIAVLAARGRRRGSPAAGTAIGNR